MRRTYAKVGIKTTLQLNLIRCLVFVERVCRDFRNVDALLHTSQVACEYASVVSKEFSWSVRRDATATYSPNVDGVHRLKSIYARCLYK